MSRTLIVEPTRTSSTVFATPSVVLEGKKNNKEKKSENLGGSKLKPECKL